LWSNGNTSQSITVSSSASDSVIVFNSLGCSASSLISLVTVNNPTSSSTSITRCDTYISPSGNHNWTTTGIYNDTIPNAIGCDSLMTISLLIHPVSYSTAYDSISNTFSLTIDSITSVLAVGYHWDFGDGTTSTLSFPSHVFTVDTTYNVCMKIYTLLGDSCDYCHVIGKDWQGNIIRNGAFGLNVVPFSSVGISQIQNPLTTITIAPNPFTSQTIITFSEDQWHNIKITDLRGKEIRTIPHVRDRQVVIEKGEMQAGVYFLRIEEENKNVVNRKIIIQ